LLQQAEIIRLLPDFDSFPSSKAFQEVASGVIFFQQKLVLKDIMEAVETLALNVYGPRAKRRSTSETVCKGFRSYLRTWRTHGTWTRIHTAFRQQVRVKQGREPTPSAAIIDRQAVKTRQKGGRRSDAGGKRVKGRKRPLLVETLRLIVGVLVHEATLQDHHGGTPLLSPLKDGLPRLQLLWAQSAYQKGGFVEWGKEMLGSYVERVEHSWSGLRGVWAAKDAVIDWEQSRPSGFHVLKWRGMVERTLAWLSSLSQALQGV